ncbi:MAG: ParB/RepB/Spo0J family partition protein [Spirochaetota bacterium]|nr:MAG: ParB/RepB/Spo0J family partition protein [Spirochaetota bacterium]
MGKTKRALGKGLDALFSEPFETEIAGESVKSIPINRIVSKKEQPRREFDRDKIEELARSIQGNGIIQPIVVRSSGQNYELVVGERRVRAAKRVGLLEIPAIVKDYPDSKIFDIALIENIQREDLNPIEEADAYRIILERDMITQEELSKRLGKSRSYIANMIRILDLPDKIKTYVSRGTISVGQAKALLSLKNQEQRLKLVERIINDKLSVRDVERMTKRRDVPRGTKVSEKEPFIEELEDQLRERFGTKVVIDYRKGRGTIKIEFYSNDELDRIIEEMRKREPRYILALQYIQFAGEQTFVFFRYMLL